MSPDVEARLKSHGIWHPQGPRELYVMRQRRTAKRFILLTIITLIIGLYLASISPP
jgi:hypothetical protein